MTGQAKKLPSIPREGQVISILSRAPEDPLQRGHELMGVHRIWPVTKGKGAKVAIIDTGVDAGHPDLKGNIKQVKDFTVSRGKGKDAQGHGTHVAGIIAANGKLKGFAPEAELYILKALGDDGAGQPEWINNALKWCGNNGIHVANLSLGAEYDDPSLHEAVRYAYDKGVTLVCAAGNEGDNDPNTIEVNYPGFYDETISVAAIDYDKIHADFSNQNDRLDVCAPGVNVVSTFPGERYVELSGTSMATPAVTGCVALIYSFYLQEFKRIPIPEEVRGVLALFSQDLGLPGKDREYGWGLFSFGADEK